MLLHCKAPVEFIYTSLLIMSCVCDIWHHVEPCINLLLTGYFACGQPVTIRSFPVTTRLGYTEYEMFPCGMVSCILCIMVTQSGTACEGVESSYVCLPRIVRMASDILSKRT